MTANADAPQIVKSIRWLYGLWIFLGLIALPLVLPAVLQGRTSVLALLFVACMLALNIWLLVTVPRGYRAAYYVQLIRSALGFLAFPVAIVAIGTLGEGSILFQIMYRFVHEEFPLLGFLAYPVSALLHGYILYYWVRRETRDWFGVGGGRRAGRAARGC